MNIRMMSVILLCNLAAGSVINSNEGDSETNVIQVEWAADEMPDPRYDPESCGISTPGWICDPDGVLMDRTFGGGPQAADSLNSELWTVANTSECPCLSHNCYTHDVIILVAIVKKLKNPDGKSTEELISAFAKKLQEDVWMADDTDCQQEIVIAMSVEDQAITTEIGDDILRSNMMSYDDVLLIGGISQQLNDPHNLVAHVKFIVETYGLYVDHPPLPDSATTPMVEPINKNKTSSEIGKKLSSNGTALSPGIIAVIIIGIFIFIGAIAIALLAPVVRKNGKVSLKYKH